MYNPNINRNMQDTFKDKVGFFFRPHSVVVFSSSHFPVGFFFIMNAITLLESVFFLTDMLFSSTY